MGLWRHGGYLHHHAGYGWGWIVMIILLVLLIVLVVFVARALYRGRHGAAAGPGWGALPPPSSPGSPQQVLAERFARGEIDAEEYRHRLGVLQNPSAPPEQPPPGS